MRFKPEDIPIPKKYTNSCAAYSWFAVGWNDHMNDKAGPNEADLRRSQGDEAWEAYSEGRRAAEEATD